MFHSWKNTFAFFSLTPSCLKSQFLWFNKDIEINNKPFQFKDFSIENINFVEHLCKPSGVFKSWSEIKTEYNLEEKNFHKWFQLLHVILNQWNLKPLTNNLFPSLNLDWKLIYLLPRILTKNTSLRAFQ